MELKDYRDMYEKMNMSEEMSGRLKEAVLNSQEREKSNMRKVNIKKTAAAAVIGCVVMAGGVSAYAASNNFSLMSIFANESADVQKSATDLLEKNVKQEKVGDEKSNEMATFEIREAICDSNRVMVQMAVKPTDSENYLLVPADCEPELDPVSNLGLEGVKVNKKWTVAEYAESMGKKCLRVSAYVDCKASGQSLDNRMEADGTLIYIIKFRNLDKKKQLDYVCHTSVMPVGGNSACDEVKGELKFTLTNKAKTELVKYLPVTGEKISGTDLVLDEVTFEKSDLGMICNVKYHYTGTEKNWERGTVDGDICFFMLDKNGKIVEINGDGDGVTIDGKSAVSSMGYSLQDLPDTITFVAKDVFEKNLYGTAKVKLAK